MKKELSPEYKRRARQSLKETQTLLDREMRYEYDLRKHDLIASYERHIVKLEKMLESGFLFDFGGISA
jgi:hypothetical protein